MLTTQTQRSLFLSFFLFIAVLYLLYLVLFKSGSTTGPLKATVQLSGNSKVTGLVSFEQAHKGAPVKVKGYLQNLDPSAKRGFHIHENGDLSDGCMLTGSHFNPLNKNHGGPTDSERHVGDLGNIESDETGVASFELVDSLISLAGPFNIIGRAVVVHTGTDDLGRGSNADSRKTGNAGGRAACGIIQPVA